MANKGIVLLSLLLTIVGPGLVYVIYSRFFHEEPPLPEEPEPEEPKMPMNHYDILGVNRTARQREITRAYRKLVLLYHPDKNKDPGSTQKFIEITDAYNVLKDKRKRKGYDQLLRFRERMWERDREEEWKQRQREREQRKREQQEKAKRQKGFFSFNFNYKDFLFDIPFYSYFYSGNG